ncbi:het-domain-containing protein [Colletotrichum asianum]
MELAVKCDRWKLPAGRRQRLESPILEGSEGTSCCELCEQLRELVAKVIIPDHRYKDVNPRLVIPRQRRKQTILHLSRLGKPELQTKKKEMKFNFYAHPDTPCPWDVMGSYCDLDLKFADHRLVECRQTHNCFQEASLPYLPTRVISVGENCSSIRLIEAHGVQGQYICLSHCWGSKQPLITTKDNIQHH